MTKQIPLTKGMFALVDDEDFELVSQYSWYVKPDDSRIYAVRNERLLRKIGIRKTIAISMHRFILNAPSGTIIDHINGNGLDNRKSNLRYVSGQQNFFNRSMNQNNKSGYKGVSWNKRQKKYASQIQISGRKLHLGYFDDPVSAAKVYDSKAKELFGEHARLNFP